MEQMVCPTTSLSSNCTSLHPWANSMINKCFIFWKMTSLPLGLLLVEHSTLFQDVLAPFTLPTCVTLNLVAELWLRSDFWQWQCQQLNLHPIPSLQTRFGPRQSHSRPDGSDEFWRFGPLLFVTLHQRQIRFFQSNFSLNRNSKISFFDVTLDGALACSLNTAFAPLKNKTICLGLKQPH